MAGVTNRGKYLMLGYTFRASTRPTNWYIALITSAAAPTADSNTFSDVTEVAAGNGYTAGGISLSLNGTDFDVWTEDDANDRAYVQIRDVVWTASGGPLPSSGSGARYAILTDDNGTQSSRQIVSFWSLTSDRTISDTQTLTLQNCEVRIND